MKSLYDAPICSMKGNGSEKEHDLHKQIDMLARFPYIRGQTYLHSESVRRGREEAASKTKKKFFHLLLIPLCVHESWIKMLVPSLRTF